MTTKYQGPLKGNPKFHCETVTDGYYFEGTRTPDPRAKIGVAMVDSGEAMTIAEIGDGQINHIVKCDGLSSLSEHLNYALSLVRFCDYVVVGFGPLTESSAEVVRNFISGNFKFGMAKNDVFFFTADTIRRCGGFKIGEPLEEIYSRNRYEPPEFRGNMTFTS